MNSLDRENADAKKLARVKIEIEGHIQSFCDKLAFFTGDLGERTEKGLSGTCTSKLLFFNPIFY